MFQIVGEVLKQLTEEKCKKLITTSTLYDMLQKVLHVFLVKTVLNAMQAERIICLKYISNFIFAYRYC